MTPDLCLGSRIHLVFRVDGRSIECRKSMISRVTEVVQKRLLSVDILSSNRNLANYPVFKGHFIIVKDSP
uniref:Uncharacterized protein n=1 Tax=Candidatus Kentrum sp. TC TaxID=2126339 RepID=A0A450YI49_9GAMM|nr:MAG: hypothetical protein BECKTC1821D_GA0114238_100827 [Candidatus Kentron sp. TC]VFK41242.1 MAG: hypothetical protein BECKTC1821E_GA0114239_101029 [Candidatus Kentron sp. TC]VFK56622.1 MAG: hypothetical protein BECKTC1821F_GA0114240_101126 [Candidatus Kentron sp. TC]